MGIVCNVYNWLSYGIVGNSVCRTWESGREGSCGCLSSLGSVTFSEFGVENGVVGELPIKNHSIGKVVKI